jgi:amino acid transporter
LPIGLISFFLDLTAIAKLASITNLLVYAFINAAFISFRIRGGIQPKTVFEKND